MSHSSHFIETSYCNNKKYNARSKNADLARSGGLEETVSLLPVPRHPDPGEGGGQEAPGLLEDGADLLRGPRGYVPRADL